MKMLLDSTVEYSNTRKQFGVPIGKFQALQHRMVDMFMAYEQSVSIVYMATLKRDGEAKERARAASAGAMPMPVSATPNAMALFSSQRAKTVTRPPARVNFTAFDKRLSRICLV